MDDDRKNKPAQPEPFEPLVLSIIRGENPALNVGRGIDAEPLTAVPEVEQPPIVLVEGDSQPVSPKVIPLDQPAEWQDHPMSPAQMADPNLARMVGQEVKIYNLADPAELSDYNRLLVESQKPLTNFLVLNEKEQFVEQTGSWKVLVRIQKFEFRKLITKPK